MIDGTAAGAADLMEAPHRERFVSFREPGTPAPYPRLERLDGVPYSVGVRWRLPW